MVIVVVVVVVLDCSLTPSSKYNIIYMLLFYLTFSFFLLVVACSKLFVSVHRFLLGSCVLSSQGLTEARRKLLLLQIAATSTLF